MHLALGDVVRDRTDMAFGTVVGVATQAGVNRVAVYVPGSTVRLTDPYDLHVVARYTRPTTTGRGLVALVVIALAVLAAILGCQYARAAAGTDWLLMFLAGLGAFAVVTTAYQWGARLAGPRRFRV